MKVPKKLRHLVNEMIKADKHKALHITENVYSDIYQTLESEEEYTVITTCNNVTWTKIDELKG